MMVLNVFRGKVIRLIICICAELIDNYAVTLQTTQVIRRPAKKIAALKIITNSVVKLHLRGRFNHPMTIKSGVGCC